MEFLSVLKNRGLKATPQRVAVLRELGKKMHPTMEEMYCSIREENPTISLATVYKNINLLKEEGIVIEINMPNSKMRYDYLSRPHVHLACKNCGCVEDLDYDENLLNFQNVLEKNRGVTIDRLDVIASVESCGFCK